MTEALQQEIRTLKNIFESERDPEGRVFAPLADAYRRAGEIQQAVRLLSQGLARHPNFVPGHVVAAQLYGEQGLAEEAAIAARKALALDGENVNAMKALLRVLESNGDEEASEVRARLVALEPDFERVGAGAAPAPHRAVPPPLPDEVAAADSGTPSGEAPLSLEGSAVDELEPSTSEAPPAPDLGSVGQGIGSAPEPLIDLNSLSTAIPEVEGGLTVGSSGLAPVSDDELPTEEPVVDLADLPAVGSEAAEEAAAPALDVSADDLPDIEDMGPTAFDEPVMELSDLGPAAEEPSETTGFASLGDDDDGGDEPVMALEDLAPEAEAPIDLADLAPDAGEEPVMELTDLAPDADAGVDVEEDDATVMDLAALAPDEPDDVVALEDLAPEAEGVLDLADLAPDADEEPVMELADLAPGGAEDEEPVMDLADLAPEVDEEPVMELTDLAPDAEEAVMEPTDLAPDEDDDATVMDLAALAPDEPEEVVALEDLAPEAEPEAVDLADLAPDEDDEAVMDLADLAPEADEEPVMELTDLAPDAGLEVVEDDATVMDLADLAPNEPEEEQPVDFARQAAAEAEEPDDVMDLAALAPEPDEEPAGDDSQPVDEAADEEPFAFLDPDVGDDELETVPTADDAAADREDDAAAEADVTMVDLVARTGGADDDASQGEAPTEDDDDHEPGEPVYTKTLAELYVKQGAVGQAIEVYEHLGQLSPDDEQIPRRIEELKSGVLVDEDGPGVLSDEAEEEVETLARELAEHGHEPHHGVDSPFTFDEASDEPAPDPDAAESGPTIGDYFEGLLGWKSEKRS